MLLDAIVMFHFALSYESASNIDPPTPACKKRKHKDIVSSEGFVVLIIS